MLTPQFSVSQDSDHVIVRIRTSSLHCKIQDAEFSIQRDTFAFHCRPYYLRLVFEQQLVEGRDERATYRPETTELEVFLPKEIPGTHFTRLDDPGFLIATKKQRIALVQQRAGGAAAPEAQRSKPMIEVLSSTSASDAERTQGDNGAAPSDDSGDEDDDEPETEYIQNLANASSCDGDPVSVHDEGNRGDAAVATYGFQNRFSAVFEGLSEEVVFDAVDIRSHSNDPVDAISNRSRRQLRIMSETEDFDADALWYSLADEDGDVEQLLRHGAFVPQYVADFEDALRRNGVKFLRPAGSIGSSSDEPQQQNQHHLDVDTVAEEDAAPVTAVIQAMASADLAEGTTAPQGTVSVKIWEGNLGSFLVDESQQKAAEIGTPSPAEAAQHAPCVADDDARDHRHSDDAETEAVTRATCGRRRLAVPLNPQPAVWSIDESHALTRLDATAPCLPRTTVTASSVWDAVDRVGNSDQAALSLTVDVLLAFVYDHITTSGTGSSESTWTVCKLSPSLSWLDTQDTTAEAVVAFARRALIYPLHRHLNLVNRCIRDVGLILMLGPTHVVRYLLQVKFILDHSEGRAVLANMYLRPLVQYWLRGDAAGCAALLNRGAWEMHELVCLQSMDGVEISAPSADFCGHRHSSPQGLGGLSVDASSLLYSRKGGMLWKRLLLRPITILTLDLPGMVDDDEGDDDE